jgi:hypothetical protein
VDAAAGRDEVASVEDSPPDRGRLPRDENMRSAFASVLVRVHIAPRPATSDSVKRHTLSRNAAPEPRGPPAAVILRRLFQAPRVSVLLPVWNGEAFLAEAIESMLRQTFSSFELIVIDDGSNDRTAASAEEFARGDERVCVLRRAHEGLSPALNAGIGEARGEYVARMDADDISVPDRLQKQVAYLDAHPACVALGSSIEVIDETGRHLGLKTFATTHDAISSALLRGVSAMAHPTVVARRDVLRAAGGYDARRYPSEDLDLWLRISEHGELANLPEALLQHRRHKAAVGVREQKQMKIMALTISNEARTKRGLRPRRGTPIVAGTNADAQYHFECARTALIAGSHLTALRHATATIASEPDRLYGYAVMLACAVPKPLLRFLLNLRAGYR